MKEITLVTPNKVGVLAGITEELGKNGVNITAISAHGVGDTGIIRLLTEDERSAIHVLARYISNAKNSYELRIGDVMLVKVPDRPGELAKIIKSIARAGINVESVYSIGTAQGKATIVIKPERFEKAVAALKKEGIRVKT